MNLYLDLGLLGDECECDVTRDRCGDVTSVQYLGKEIVAEEQADMEIDRHYWREAV